jgi:hypothetical protein
MSLFVPLLEFNHLKGRDVNRLGAVVVCAALSGILDDDPFQPPFTEQLAHGLGFRQELVAQIHPHMQVILPEQHHAAWLGENDNGNLKELLPPYPADQMRMWEISPRANSAGV